MASPLSLDVAYLFSVHSSIFLLMVVQWLVAIVVLWQEKMSACRFTTDLSFLYIICLFLVALGVCCCSEPALVGVHVLLIVVAGLIVKRGL